MRRGLLLVPVLALSACVAGGRMPIPEANAPVFAPIAFFAGRTEGNGRLLVALSRSRSVHVVGDGKIGPDGTLTLVQRIEQQGSPARGRTWSLRSTGAGGYESTLTDADGPVALTVDGSRLRIRFRAKGGVEVEQWLVLASDGRTARNHLEARKFGLRVATLDETIRKID